MSRMPTASPFSGFRDNNNFDRQSYGGGLPMQTRAPRPIQAGPAMPSQGMQGADQTIADDTFRHENAATQAGDRGRSKAVAGAMQTFDPTQASADDIAEARKQLGAVDAGQEYHSRKLAMAKAQSDLDDHARKYGFSTAAIQRAMGDSNAGDASDGRFVDEVNRAQDLMQKDKAFASWSKVHSQALDKAQGDFKTLEARGQAPAPVAPENPTGDTDTFGKNAGPKTPEQRLAGSTFLKMPSAGGQLYDGSAPKADNRNQEYKGALLDPGSPEMVSNLRAIAAERARKGYDGSDEAKGYQAQVAQANDARTNHQTVRGLQDQRTADARGAQTFQEESAVRQANAAEGFAAANKPSLAKGPDGETTATPPAVTYSPRPMMPGTAGPNSMPGGPQYGAATDSPAIAQTPTPSPRAPTQRLTPGLPVADGSAGYHWWDSGKGEGVRTDLETGTKSTYIQDPQRGWVDKQTGVPLNAAPQTAGPPAMPTPADNRGVIGKSWDAIKGAVSETASLQGITNPGLTASRGAMQGWNGTSPPASAAAPPAAAPAPANQGRSVNVNGVMLTERPDGTWVGTNGRLYRQAAGRWQAVS